MLSAAEDPMVSDGTLMVSKPPSIGPPGVVPASGPLKLIPPVEVSALVVMVCCGLMVGSFGNEKRVMPPLLTAMLGEFTFVADNWPALIAPVTVSPPKTLMRFATASLPLIRSVTVQSLPVGPIEPSELSTKAFRSPPSVTSPKVALMNVAEPMVPPGVPNWLLRISKFAPLVAVKLPFTLNVIEPPFPMKPLNRLSITAVTESVIQCAPGVELMLAPVWARLPLELLIAKLRRPVVPVVSAPLTLSVIFPPVPMLPLVELSTKRSNFPLLAVAVKEPVPKREMLPPLPNVTPVSILTRQNKSTAVSGPPALTAMLLPLVWLALVGSVCRMVTPPKLTDDDPLRVMLPPLLRPLPSVTRTKLPVVWNAPPVLRTRFKPSVMPPLKRSISVLPTRVRLLSPDTNTLPDELIAVAVCVPAFQLRSRMAAKSIVTAERFTGVVFPILKSRLELARNVSARMVPPFNVMSPAEGGIEC